MAQQFNFQIDNRLLYGLGHSRELPRFIQERAFKRILLLADEGVEKHSWYFKEISDLIASVSTVDVQKLRSGEEPDYDYLEAVASTARALPIPDLLIGIGGGSVMDIAKAVAVLLTNAGRGIDYRGFDKLQKPGVPTLLIPTTAGTGSEVTINAVFTDKQEMRKLGINGRYMNATWALLDAEWTMSCPPSAAISAGMDAMVHTLESFMCRQHNDLTRVFSREAFRLLFENLPCLVDAPDDREQRQKLLLGAYLAGAGLFNSGSGISGAFSYPLGVNFKIPHGICGAVFIASVVDYNVANGYHDYAELLDLIERDNRSSASEKSRRFAVVLREFCDHMKVPRYLNEWGVTARNAGEVAKMLLPLQGAFDQNPVPFSAEKNAPTLLNRHIKAA